MSKGYTIEFYIREISGLNNKAITNKLLQTTGLWVIISPKLGIFSVKYKKLSNLLGYEANLVAKGIDKYSNLGKTPKTRLIKALKIRKKYGVHFYGPSKANAREV